MDFIFVKMTGKMGPRWATAAAAATAEEFCQAIQAPSPTHPGTTYPVRASPHSDVHDLMGEGLMGEGLKGECMKV